MEFVLLIIAGAVVYYLYISLQEYLKNPLKQKEQEQKISNFDDPYEAMQPESLQERYLGTELGAMQAVILSIPNCKKEYLTTIAQCMGEWYRVHYTAFDYRPQEKELLEHGGEADYSKLLNATYAEYKKRLNFIGLMLVVMYLDGKLDGEEREFLLDVAAHLSLENTDFNALYDEFEAGFKEVYQEDTQVEEDKTKQETSTEESKDMTKDLNEIFKEGLIDIFDYKNQNKSFLDSALKLYKSLRDF